MIPVKATLFLVMINLCVPFGIYSQTHSTEIVQSATPVDANKLLAQAKTLVMNKEFAQAKKLLHQILDREKTIPKRPYIKNETLHMYVHNQGEVLAFSSVNSLPDDQRMDALKKIWHKVAELHKTETWTNIIFEHPTAPDACQTLAYIAVEEGKTNEALKHLNRAIELWDSYLSAHAEYVFILMKQKKYDEAKDRAKNALDHHNKTDRDGMSRLYRHLGYIAIEENELDAAEDFYHKALKLTPNNSNALQELQYIQQLRDKKK